MCIWERERGWTACWIRSGSSPRAECRCWTWPACSGETRRRRFLLPGKKLEPRFSYREAGLLAFLLLVGDEGPGVPGDVAVYDGFENISAEIERQAPVKAVGIRSCKVVEDEIVRVVEQSLGVGHAEVDRSRAGAHRAHVGGAQVLVGRRAIPAHCRGTAGNSCRRAVEEEDAV